MIIFSCPCHVGSYKLTATGRRSELRSDLVYNKNPNPHQKTRNIYEDVPNNQNKSLVMHRQFSRRAIVATWPWVERERWKTNDQDLLHAFLHASSREAFLLMLWLWLYCRTSVICDHTEVFIAATRIQLSICYFPQDIVCGGSFHWSKTRTWPFY